MPTLAISALTTSSIVSIQAITASPFVTVIAAFETWPDPLRAVIWAR